MTKIAQIDYNNKSVDCVLGTRTRGGRINPLSQGGTPKLMFIRVCINSQTRRGWCDLKTKISANIKLEKK